MRTNGKKAGFSNTDGARYLESINSGDHSQMALQPPSYFQAPSTSSKQQPKNEKKLPETVQVLPTSPSLPATSGPLQLHLAGQQAAAAVLTSDLLAVETHLQSRVRLLEEEKNNLISRIIELEKSLVQQKEEGRAQLETLTTQHNQSLLQVRVSVYVTV